MAEAETELVGGYHTEYSSMRFALFFLAEYGHLITSCAFFSLLFLGGWDILPFVNILPTHASGWAGLGLVLLKFGIFFGKVVFLVCFSMVIRWTLPRLRYDQIMQMAWGAVIPISLIVVLLTSVMVFFGLTGLLPMLGVNIILAAAIWAVLPFLPRYNPNERVPMYGSRFCPVPGELVKSAPTHPLALEDRPIEGTAPTA